MNLVFSKPRDFTSISLNSKQLFSIDNNDNHCLRLVKDLNRLNPTCPVIFNAMGWLRELGLTLLRDSLNIGNIDLIYYLETKTSNDLPEDISLEEIFEERRNIIGRPIYEGNNRCRLDIPKIRDQSNSKSAMHQKKQYFTRKFNPR